jgi:hypothetical protein
MVTLTLELLVLARRWRAKLVGTRKVRMQNSAGKRQQRRAGLFPQDRIFYTQKVSRRVRRVKHHRVARAEQTRLEALPIRDRQAGKALRMLLHGGAIDGWVVATIRSWRHTGC